VVRDEGINQARTPEEALRHISGMRPFIELPDLALVPSEKLDGTQLAAINAGVAVYDPDLTHHAILSHGEVRRLARRLAILPYEQRKKVKALVPGRADVIVAGAEILLSVMEAFDTPEVLTSEKDILDGLVMELLTGDLPG